MKNLLISLIVSAGLVSVAHAGDAEAAKQNLPPAPPAMVLTVTVWRPPFRKLPARVSVI